MMAPSTPTPITNANDRAAALHVFLRGRSDGGQAADDPIVAALLNVLRQRFGDSLAAVLIYGSYLRGKRDTVLDFYALLDDFDSIPRWQAVLCRMLAPNVYLITAALDGSMVHAKCATLSLARFERAMRHDFHSYFWARFAQPSKIVYCRNEATREKIIAAQVDAAHTFIERALPMLDSPVSTHDLWEQSLGLTYRCELRAEKRGYAAGLVHADPNYFQTLTRLLTISGLVANGGPDANRWTLITSPAERRQSQMQWHMRRWLGKVLSVARMAKSATMFEASLDYILWKIERHSGMHIEPTSRQRRFPLLFAWPLLWRLYRRGAFR